MIWTRLRACVKATAKIVSCVLVWPAAALTGWGRVRTVYTLFAHAFALLPGIPGDYVRLAYYRFTLRQCSLDSRISFGTFFAHPEAEVGRYVYVGAYCVIGKCRLGDRTQIASQVQILSGRRQHARNSAGRLGGSETGLSAAIEIGRDCWIGASAIVMANLGDGVTIGAGAVVVSDLPSHVVAVGNPARVLRTQSEHGFDAGTSA